MNRRGFLGVVAGLVASVVGKVPLVPPRTLGKDAYHEAIGDMALGSVLMDPETTSSVLSVIGDHRWFLSSEAALVYTEIKILHKRGVKPSLEAVHQSLKSVGLLDLAGGYERLLQMVGAVPNPRNARFFAESLIRVGKRRPGRCRTESSQL
jgi:replicative DNA helicase